MLEYSFMKKAMVAGIVVGTSDAIVGTYVVLRGMSFIGSGIAHASLGGIALGLMLGINPVMTSVAFCLATALGIGLTSQKARIKEDTAIGILSVAAMAFGILLLGFVKGYTTDVLGILFGNILAVTNEDLLISFAIGALVIGTVALFYKEFLFISFDEEMARASGLPVGAINSVMLGLIAAIVVLSLKVTGIILVSALVVIPPAAAHQLAKGFKSMILLSSAFGNTSVLLGLLISYYLDMASGATIVLVALGLFLLSWGLKSLTGIRV
jgi:zinc transport system permease protein